MIQRFFVGTVKPSKWLALTMSFNISKRQKRRYITLTTKWSHFHTLLKYPLFHCIGGEEYAQYFTDDQSSSQHRGHKVISFKLTMHNLACRGCFHGFLKAGRLCT